MADSSAGDINSIIASAVNARIESQVAEALSGDALIGQYVMAALNQEIEIGRDSWNRRKTTFLKNTIDVAIQEATKSAVASVVKEQAVEIEAQVRQVISANVGNIAETLVNKVVEKADSPYGISVQMQYPGE